MPGASFAENLIKLIKQKKSYICVGLDPEFEGGKGIPSIVLKQKADNYNNAIWTFNKDIIDATFQCTPVYKPQIAFYEKYGAYDALRKTIDYVHKVNSLVILDAKRNDIGNTSKAYAAGVFNDMKADAVTLNGYLGSDCIKPFLEFTEKGLFILVKTSNKSSVEFQDAFVMDDIMMNFMNEHVKNDLSSLELEEISKNIKLMQDGLKTDPSLKSASTKPVMIRNYVKMARLVKKWSDDWKAANDPGAKYSSVGAVVGATFPQQLKSLRKEMPDSIILIPGYGAQGGTAADIVNGFNPDGLGAIINSSRGINYAYTEKINGQQFKMDEYKEAAKLAALIMCEDINTALNQQNLLQW
jgi:orotidine-5'-phosphate decarboxylase